MKKIFSILFVFLFVFFAKGGASLSFAQEIPSEFDYKEELLEGKVVAIKDEGSETVGDELMPFQDLEILITLGSLKDQKIDLKNSAGFAGGGTSAISYFEYKTGDKLRIYSSAVGDDQPNFTIQGKVKRQALYILGAIFVVIVLVVGRKWGALSLLGLLISFLFIFKLSIPLILQGKNPVVVMLGTAFLIIPTTFYISHGFNKKTHAAALATFLSLSFTAFLAIYFVDLAHLTGFSSEEAGFVDIISGGKVNILSLLLAGMIIGALGILDDITIGQSSVVQQLQKSDPKIKRWPLFAKAMKVGQDHISSMVNTLVLVYAGSALPLLLLFFDSNKTFIDVIELELVAEEIIRMLVGSIGLVIAAPLATLLAVLLFTHKKKSLEN
jgi:uncharacterized membrane protein